tara:strand:+ start:649 stop:816 length:168 start_codon:yes stop_codon:yes gene_type:complete
MNRVKIQGTTIFGYVREDYKESKLKKVSFLDEETKQVRRITKSLIRETEQKDRYN